MVRTFPNPVVGARRGKPGNGGKRRQTDIPSVDLCGHSGPPQSNKQPSWPDQIGLHELVPGTVVQEMFTHPDRSSSMRVETVTRAPYRDGNGHWWIDTEYTVGGQLLQGRHSLSDKNYYPYESGKWNSWNYLRRASA